MHQEFSGWLLNKAYQLQQLALLLLLWPNQALIGDLPAKVMCVTASSKL